MPVRTLYAKLSLVLVALLVVIGVVYSLVSFYAARHHLQEVDQQVNRNLARTLVADRNLVREGRLNEEEVKATFESYMTINPSIEIYLLGLDGAILSYSADPGKVKRRSVSLAPIQAFVSGDPSFPLLGDDPRSHDRRKPFSVTPVPSAEAPEGYLYVVLRGERYDSMETLLEESYLLRQSGWTVAGSLALSLVIGLVVFHLLTRPLRLLTADMDSFRRSDFTAHRPLAAETGAASDEVDVLARTFDAMADRIVAQIEALKRQDALRRDLVAQVSHDLRTPLAALHGYLETMHLKAESLAGEERAEYLDIALRQSERLGRLVADLFELTKLEAQERRPVHEPFSIADLLQDVAQKMAIVAERANARIQLDTPAGVSIAAGDIALVERVLDNLLGNALEHVDDDGTVRLGVRDHEHGIEVSVFNTGPAIAADALEQIFEPYYRVGGSSARGHAGLGLAIARRIVELHGGVIRVDSTPRTGTTFAFTLPAWSAGEIAAAASA